MPRTRRTKTPILRRRNSIDSTPITDIAEGTVTVTGGTFYPISRRLRGVRVREHGTEIHLHRHSTPNKASPRRTRASTRLQKKSVSPNIHSHREPSPITPRSKATPKAAKRKKKTTRTDHSLDTASAPDESESRPDETERVQMALESRFQEQSEPNNHEPDSPKAWGNHFHLIVRNVSIFILVFPILLFVVNYRLNLPLVNHKQAEGGNVHDLSKVSTDNIPLKKLLATEKNEANIDETTSKRLQRELDALKTMIRYSDKKHQLDMEAIRKEMQDGIADDKVRFQEEIHELHLGIKEMKQKLAELVTKNARDITGIRQHMTKVLNASTVVVNKSETRIGKKLNELAKEVDSTTESALSSAQKIAVISDGIADLNKTISKGTLNVAAKYRADFETTKNNVLEAVRALRLNDESMANNLSDMKMTLGDHENIITEHSLSLNTQTNELHSVQQSVKDTGMDLENKLQPFKDQVSNCTTHLNALRLEVQTQLHQLKGLKSKELRKELDSIRSSLVKQMNLISNIKNGATKLDQDQETRKHVSNECAAKAEEKFSALYDGLVERVKSFEKELQHAADSQPSSLSYDEVKGVVDQSLEVYNADRVGLVDYAIEVAGGSIVYSLTSPTYYMSLSTRLSANVVPEAVIRANMNLGHCWPFKGDKGDIGIHLYPHSKVVANGISLEHVPKSVAHNIGSAPRDFEVWAYQHPQDGTPKKLFTGVYDIQTGKAVQTFKWHNVDDVVPIIQVRILSNFGHPIHTCVYRIRVHGIVTDQ